MKVVCIASQTKYANALMQSNTGISTLVFYGTMEEMMGKVKEVDFSRIVIMPQSYKSKEELMTYQMWLMQLQTQKPIELLAFIMQEQEAETIAQQLGMFNIFIMRPETAQVKPQWLRTMLTSTMQEIRATLPHAYVSAMQTTITAGEEQIQEIGVQGVTNGTGTQRVNGKKSKGKELLLGILNRGKKGKAQVQVQNQVIGTTEEQEPLYQGGTTEIPIEETQQPMPMGTEENSQMGMEEFLDETGEINQNGEVGEEMASYLNELQAENQGEELTYSDIKQTPTTSNTNAQGYQNALEGVLEDTISDSQTDYLEANANNEEFWDGSIAESDSQRNLNEQLEAVTQTASSYFSEDMIMSESISLEEPIEPEVIATTPISYVSEEIMSSLKEEDLTATNEPVVITKEVIKEVSVKGKGSTFYDKLKAGNEQLYVIVTGDRRSGLTTTSLRLSEAIARDNIPTLFVDFDIERRNSLFSLDLTHLLDAPSQVKYGIFLCDETKKLKNSIWNTLDTKFSSLVSLPAEDEAMEQYQSKERLTDTAEALTSQELFSAVIIDCPLENLPKITALLEDCLIICCAEVDRSGVSNLLSYFDSLSLTSRKKDYILKHMVYAVKSTEGTEKGVKGDMLTFKSNLEDLTMIYSLENMNLRPEKIISMNSVAEYIKAKL